MQEIKLNIVPGGVIPVLHATQYDVGRELKFLIFDGNSPASLTGTTATIEGTKPDGNGFSYECTISNNEVTVETTAQMTVLSGSIDCKITFFKESDRIGTALFILDIEKAALNSDTPISEAEIPPIIALAREQEQNAEAWAVGTKNGEPVSEDDPQYENSSKWWAEYAESAVTGVTGVKGNAETNYRRGNVNLTPSDLGALSTDGDSEDNTVTFTSSDDDSTTDKTSDGMTEVITMASGESHASLFEKISKMFLNIRKLWNTVGTENISGIGQTVTGAIYEQYNTFSKYSLVNLYGKYTDSDRHFIVDADNSSLDYTATQDCLIFINTNKPSVTFISIIYNNKTMTIAVLSGASQMSIHLPLPKNVRIMSSAATIRSAWWYPV